MRLTFALGLVAAVVALDSDANANTNAPRDSAATERPDGSEGQPPRWPMRDIAANVMRDASAQMTFRAAEKRDATGRCPDGQTPIPNGNPSLANGCGPEKFEGLVPEFWFNACCGDHDICYGDCAKTKGACDGAFISCMNAACDTEFPGGWKSARWYGCRAKAGVYWSAVKIGGQSSYEGGTRDHCTCVAA